MVSRLLGFVREAVLAARLRRLGPGGRVRQRPPDRQRGRGDPALRPGDARHPGLPERARRRGEDSAWRLISALAGWVGVLLVLVSSLLRDLARGAGGALPPRPRTRRDLRRAHPDHGAGPRPPGVLGALHGDAADPRPLRGAGGGGRRVQPRDHRRRSRLPRARSASRPRRGAWSLGATAQVVLQLPQFFRLLRNAHARPAFTHPRLGAVGLLALPVLGASALQQINSFTDKLFASSLESGRVAALNFANALGPGAPGGAAAAPHDAALPADRAPHVGAPRDGGALRPSSAWPACSPWSPSRSALLMAIYSTEVAQLAFGARRSAARSA